MSYVREGWITRDHVLIVQAARNIDDAPLYAHELVAQTTDPITAALQIIAVLMTERVESWTEVQS